MKLLRRTFAAIDRAAFVVAAVRKALVEPLPGATASPVAAPIATAPRTAEPARAIPVSAEAEARYHLRRAVAALRAEDALATAAQLFTRVRLLLNTVESEPPRPVRAPSPRAQVRQRAAENRDSASVQHPAVRATI